MVTFTTDNHDGACQRHDWFLDHISRWLATDGVRWFITPRFDE